MSDDLRLKAARDAGLPDGLAERLQGTTEAELFDDAQRLVLSLQRPIHDMIDRHLDTLSPAQIREISAAAMRALAPRREGYVEDTLDRLADQLVKSLRENPPIT